MSCDRKIGPLDCCSVVQGDCLELLKLLPDGSVDAVITDPPYGINYDPTAWKKWNGLPSQFSKVYGDDKDFDPSPLLRFGKGVMWGANNFVNRLPLGGWLIWDKRCHESLDAMFGASFEMAWTSTPGLKIVRVQHGGVVNADSRRGNNAARLHPTQKPVRVMEESIEAVCEPDDTILDPFAGSGTTLVAAKKLGRHFLGFEISPEYCEIARKRIALVEAQPNLFQPKPEQQPLEGL